MALTSRRLAWLANRARSLRSAYHRPHRSSHYSPGSSSPQRRVRTRESAGPRAPREGSDRRTAAGDRHTRDVEAAGARAAQKTALSGMLQCIFTIALTGIALARAERTVTPSGNHRQVMVDEVVSFFARVRKTSEDMQGRN